VNSDGVVNRGRLCDRTWKVAHDRYDEEKATLILVDQNVKDRLQQHAEQRRCLTQRKTLG